MTDPLPGDQIEVTLTPGEGCTAGQSPITQTVQLTDGQATYSLPAEFPFTADSSLTDPIPYWSIYENGSWRAMNYEESGAPFTLTESTRFMLKYGVQTTWTVRFEHEASLDELISPVREMDPDVQGSVDGIAIPYPLPEQDFCDLSSDDPIRFMGWYRTIDGVETKVGDPGDEVEITGDTTFVGHFAQT